MKIRISKNKRFRLISLAIAAAALLACLVALFTAFKGRVGAEEIVTDSEVSTLELAYDGRTYYYGTKDGRICEIDGEGKVVNEAQLFESEMVQKIAVLDGERILVCGSGTSVVLLDESLSSLAELELDGLFLTVSHYVGDEELFWFGVSSNSNYTDLYLFSYRLDGSSFTPLAGSAFYTLSGEGEDAVAKQEKFVTRNVTVSADGKYLCIFAKKGSVYKISSDLSLMGKDADALRESHVASFAAPDEIYTIVYDTETELFYFGLRNGGIMRMDWSLAAEGFSKVNNVVASIRYDQSEKILYVPYSLYNDITAIDATDGEILYSFSAQYNIDYVLAFREGNSLLVLWEDEDTERLFSYELSSLAGLEAAKAWKAALRTMAAVAAVVAVVLVGCLISDKFAVRLKRGGIRFFKNLWKGKWIYLVSLPSLALLLTFCYYPAVASIVNAFYDYSAGSAKIFAGVQNFVEIFHDAYFFEMLRNMVVFMASDCLLALIPPIFFAFCLTIMKNKRFAKGMRFALFFPGILPGIATALLWKNGIYGDYGVLNTLIKAVGGREVTFLGSSATSMPSLIFMGFPWVGSYLIFYGAMMNIPGEIYEAAELEGCRLWRRIWNIDIPFIAGQIKYVFIITFIHSAQSLGKLQATTKGSVGTMTPMYKLYLYLNNNEYGMASAMAVLILLVLSVATIINMRNKIKSEAAYG